MKRFHFYILILLTLSVFSCVSTDEDAVKSDPVWDDTARFLAALPVREESPLKSLTTAPEYKDHALFMKSFWERVEKENIAKISTWHGSNVPADRKTRLAIYPFSGADFVNLQVLYPRCTEYLMIALEEPGKVPDLLAMKPWELYAGLSSLRRVMSSIATQNYFKSAVMKQEMTNQFIDGTIPVLMIFTARLGNRIISVEHVMLDEAGNIRSYIPGTGKAAFNPAVRGCRICFISPEGRKRKVLTYLRMRLGKDTLETSTCEGKFFNSLPRFGMITKSAVYLLHGDSLQNMNRYLLERSDIIFQDDSGIPYRMFKSDDWDISLHGTYTSPPFISDLSFTPVQNDLALAYKNSRGKLPFNFGYGVLAGPGRSNLLCAVRKQKN